MGISLSPDLKIGTALEMLRLSGKTPNYPHSFISEKRW